MRLAAWPACPPGELRRRGCASEKHATLGPPKPALLPSSSLGSTASLGCLQKALVKGYTAPALPKAAYSHGLGDKSHQLVMARESRRIVLRWLEGANPAIGALAAGTVLDTDR